MISDQIGRIKAITRSFTLSSDVGRDFSGNETRAGWFPNPMPLGLNE